MWPNSASCPTVFDQGEGRGRGELTYPDRLCDQTLSFLSHRFVQGGGRGRGELTYPDRLCDQTLSFLSHHFVQGGGRGRGELTYPDMLCDQTLSFLSHHFVQGGGRGRGELTYPDRLCDQTLSCLSNHSVQVQAINLYQMTTITVENRNKSLYMSWSMAKPTKWQVRPEKTQISLNFNHCLFKILRNNKSITDGWTDVMMNGWTMWKPSLWGYNDHGPRYYI